MLHDRERYLVTIPKRGRFLLLAEMTIDSHLGYVYRWFGQYTNAYEIHPCCGGISGVLQLPGVLRAKEVVPAVGRKPTILSTQ